MASFPIPDDVILRHLCPHLAPGDAIRFACTCRRHAACLRAVFHRTRDVLYHDAGGEAIGSDAITSWVRAAENARRTMLAQLEDTPVIVCGDHEIAGRAFRIDLYEDRASVRKPKTTTRAVDVATLCICDGHVTGDAITGALHHVMTAYRPTYMIEIKNECVFAHALRDEHLAIVAGVPFVYLWHHACITDAGVESLGKNTQYLGLPMCGGVTGEFLPRRVYHDRAPLLTIDVHREWRSLRPSPFGPRIQAWLEDQAARGLIRFR